MSKKRIIVPILALVLVLVMSLGLFVACNDTDEKTEYTVTFKNGDSVVSTVTVEEGTALTAEQIPTLTIDDDSVFDGWFVGDVQVVAGYVPTANVDAVAKISALVEVVFKNGDDVVDTVKVKTGVALTAEQIPAGADVDDARFDGWFVGNDRVQAGYVVNAAVVAQAKYSSIGPEAGTYTDKAGVGADLVLDGVDAGTLGDDKITYTIDGDVVTIGDDQYKLVDGNQYILNDKMAGAYSAQVYGIVTITLDGYGNATYADSYATDNGTYVLTDDSISFTFPTNSSADATYQIVENGNVLYLEDYYGEIAYIKDGYTVPADGANAFAGLWKSADGDVVEIAVVEGVPSIKVNGVEASAYAVEFNWNYTKLSDMTQSQYYPDVYQIVEGNLVKNDEVTFTKANAGEIVLTVRFIVESEPVATVSVKYGQAIDPDEIPSDPTAPFAFAFDGWFDGNVEFDENALVYASADYVAEFSQSQEIVVFMNGSEEVSKIAIDFRSAFTVDQIPAAPAGTGVFVGWYTSDGTKAEAGATVKSGMTVTYNALFVTESDYAGNWVNTSAQEMLLFGDNNKVSVLGKNNKSWTFDSATGEATFSEGSLTSTHTYKMLVIGDTLTLKHTYYDDVEEEFVTDVSTYKKATGTLSGEFVKSSSYRLTIVNNVITWFGTSQPYYGYVTASGSRYIINYKSSQSSELIKIATSDITLDANGNFVITGGNSTTKGIWVADCTDVKDYYNSTTSEYIHVYTTSSNTFVVYQDGEGVYSYATTDVAIADGAIVTLTYGDSQTLTVKISGTKYELPGAEAGSYTGDEGALVLNGFGNATLADASATYTVNAQGYVLIGEKAYVLNEGAYTVLTERDGLQGVFIQSDNSQYVYTLDGFGGIVVNYNGTYSQSEYIGRYTFNDDKTQITLADINYSYNGVYSIEENGNALVRTSPSQKVMIKDGYTVTMQNDKFIGEWTGDAGDVVITESTVSYKGSSYTAKWNWNGSSLTFEAKDGNNYYPNINLTHTVSIVEGNLVIEHTYYTGYDDVFEELTGATVVSESFAPAQGGDDNLDAFAGTYTAGSNVLVLDGKGAGTWNDLALTYTVTGDNTIAISAVGAFDGTGNSATLSGSTLSIHLEDEFGDNVYNADLAKQATEETLDAFAGTYTAGSNVLVLDGKGAGTWNDLALTYTVTGDNTIAISAVGAFDGTGNSATLSGSTLSIHLADEYNDNVYNADLAKQAAAD